MKKHERSVKGRVSRYAQRHGGRRMTLTVTTFLLTMVFVLIALYIAHLGASRLTVFDTRNRGVIYVAVLHRRNPAAEIRVYQAVP
ncbi:MAG: hypothetical protein ACLGJB_00455 [Blastocatellia bacterium]